MVTPLPTRPPPHDFQKSSKIVRFLMKIFPYIFVFCSRVLTRFKVHNDIFPTTLYVLGLLFCIPEQNDTQVGNSDFPTSSGRETGEVVVVIVIIVVAPLPHDPHPMIFIFSKIDHFLKENATCFFVTLPTRFEVHNDLPTSHFNHFSHNTLCWWVSFSTSLSKHKAQVGNHKF